LICVSGWRNKEYMRVARRFAGRVPVVCMSDNKWQGSFRQQLLIRWPATRFLRRHFDGFLVPGPHQFGYARMLGYDATKIFLNLYSGDTPFFNQSCATAADSKRRRYPHTILYVGRLSPEKGCDLLVGAFNDLCSRREHDWRLVLVGNGSVAGADVNKR